MNPLEIFDKNEFNKVNRIVGRLENRDYTKDEYRKMESEVIEYIMSQSFKNGDISKARDELDSVLNKIQNFK